MSAHMGVNAIGSS